MKGGTLNGKAPTKKQTRQGLFKIEVVLWFVLGKKFRIGFSTKILAKYLESATKMLSMNWGIREN